MSAAHTIRLAVERGVNTLTLDRPAAGNSVSLRMIQELDEALSDVEQTTDGVALVIAGAGDRFFCTGGDVKEYAAFADQTALQAQFGRMRRFCERLEALPLPVIAAIDGLAIGGGMELALACDFRVARSGVTLRLPQVQLGLITGWGAHARLVRAVGEARALDLLLTARPVSAEEALALGLVHRIASSALAEAHALADGFRQASPAALAAAKAAVRSVQRPPQGTVGFDAEAAFLALWFGPDHREAEQAFRERRPARFRHAGHRPDEPGGAEVTGAG